MAGFQDKGADFVGPPARAKLFKHGGSQAVRLPKAFRFEGEEVLIRREGERVILEPARKPPATPQTDAEWAAFWAEIDELMGGQTFERPPQGDFPEPVKFDD